MELRIPAWADGTLQPMDKVEVHRRGLRHPAVSVFVTEGSRVLIQRRAAGKYHTPLLWANTCCTHPHWGEPALDCAIRRLDEELGITGLHLTHADQLEYRADVGGGMVEHELVDVFRAEAPPGLPLRSDPAEVAEIRWIDLAALVDKVRARPQDFTPWMRLYMTRHFDRIFAEPQAPGRPQNQGAPQ